MTTNSKKIDWKKLFVFAGMGLLFAGAMYMILVPSSKTKDEQDGKMGLNTEIPLPAQNEIIEDKRTAYEQELIKQIQRDRMRTLEDFTSMVNAGNQDDDIFLTDVTPEKTTSASRTGNNSGRSLSPAQSSLEAYRGVNSTLGSFYEKSSLEDNNVKQLQEEVEFLKNQLESQQGKTAMEEQLELIEKSYQMASKYMPAMQSESFSADNSVPEKSAVSGKTVKRDVIPVSSVREQVVSALNQPISDLEFIEIYSQERNMGFHSPESAGEAIIKNTISACIHDDQTVSDGMETQRNVRIRLLEPMLAGGMVIPANTILTGQTRIGERLDVAITSIEYQGRIYATDITVFDTDGQKGIAIPPSMEVNALKEIAANAGTNMGTSITLSQNAGQQIAADMGKGLIQGTSQYFARKVRVVKIHLKAGHQIFLLSNSL